MNSQEKSREHIKAEREAKKAAKAASKGKPKVEKPQVSTGSDDRLINDVNTSASSAEVKPSGLEKSREQVKSEREAKKAAKAAGKVKPKAENAQVSSESERLVNDLCTSLSSIELKTTDPEKSREHVKLEREAKKAAKAAAKGKVKEEKCPIQKPVSEETIPEPQIVTATNLSEAQPKEKSKSELRAERRAKQEAQRAAKQEVKEEKKVKPVKKVSIKSEPAKAEVKPENLHEVNLFKHLYSERKLIFDKVNPGGFNIHIHPAIIRLGLRYAEKVIIGSNARCVAFLAAVKQMIHDFERPPNADFSRGLETALKESTSYLARCRPHSVSMQNALKHFKRQMNTLPAAISDEEAKVKLKTAIDQYIQEQILLADDAISLSIQTKISEGDVILTYGYSSLIHKILCDAYTAKKQFRVIVVDSRPWLEGKELLRRLAQHGIECSYFLINSLSSVMPKVNKVFLGAHAILANGAVMARVGTAQVAVMAKASNVPVLVACETHKSSERVQTDSIVHNEIGDPDALKKNTCDSKKSSLTNWRTLKSLNLLNLMYDVTPAELVTAVVTELAILPCTSVPVILRITV